MDSLPRHPLLQAYYRVALAPRGQLLSGAALLLTLALGLIVLGLWLYRPATVAVAAIRSDSGPLTPPDFTPLASPPPAFAQLAPSPTPLLPSSMAATTTTALPPPPTATPLPIEWLLAQEALGSTLDGRRYVTVLLLGTDARPGQGEASRSDTIMVIIMDLVSASATLISVPRDLWVAIPGYGEARINTAYFLGQGYDEGPELARQTVSQLLGLPISQTLVVDFDGFRTLVDAIGGLEIEVPEAIDDPLYPDYNYGTFRLQIPAGPQQMDGERALQYARTRHGSSDFARAERQQLVLQAIRAKLLSAEYLPRLPSLLRQGAAEVTTTLSLADLFFLARFAVELDEAALHLHVIQAPLLWNGVTADGQQVLLYDPYTLQSAVQGWLWEAQQP